MNNDVTPKEAVTANLEFINMLEEAFGGGSAPEDCDCPVCADPGRKEYLERHVREELEGLESLGREVKALAGALAYARTDTLVTELQEHLYDAGARAVNQALSAYMCFTEYMREND